jgi:hypothetical protein
MILKMSESGDETIWDTDALTSREGVSQTLSGALPVSRKRRIACVSTKEGPTDTLARTLDKAIRWNTFLFSVNLLWTGILKSVYGNDIDMDSDTVVSARNKIFECTKRHKSNVLLHGFSKMKGRASNLWK